MTASARGLFRATGKKAKPIAVSSGNDILGPVEVADFRDREKDEFYPTPPEPTRAYLAVEIDRLRDFGTVWEPACGDGAMVREMESAGLKVVASDLVYRGLQYALHQNFFAFEQAPAPAIVTNPPFAECNRDPGWVRHALERLRIEYMALLLPVNWMGSGSERAALWSQFPPARVYVMRWRVDWTGAGAPPMLTAWYVWDKAHQGETVLRMLDRKDARQSEISFEGTAA